MNETTLRNTLDSARVGQSPSGHGFSTLKGIRTQEALARFGGDEERYRHWLLDFVGHGPNATAQIRQAITNGSTEAALKLAHSLKGRTGMLGMNELHTISQTLESALRDGDSPTLWLEELESAVEAMRHDIENAFDPPVT